MATDPKIKPCFRCGNDDNIAIYTYEHGWRHVECDKCDALGPGEGNRRQAIKSWNEQQATLGGRGVAPATDGAESGAADSSHAAVRSLSATEGLGK